MALSASGLFTLLAVLLVGPLYYGGLHIYRNRNGIVTESSTKQDTNDEERDVIDTKHYLFALIGYAIGIGNVWRFPYVIAQHGGGAALVAYIVSAILVACPLFLYEMIMGQHTKLSTIRCYDKVRPRWKGLGIASGLMLFIILCYYGMVIAYTLPYIWNSLQTPLPWIATGAENFWLDNVLGSVDDNVSGLGGVQGTLVVSLFCFWIIVFMTVGFGREILAKITVITVLLPVGLMAIMVIRTVFLEGAGEGIKFYIGRFEIKYLWNARTWAAACGQALFSMSPGLGTVITYSSYAKPKEDVYRACMIVSLSNCVFSIFAAFATFSLVGHMATQSGVSVEDLATRSGSGLAFITMAEAMQYFGSAANAMSVLFFSTLFLLGLDSAYAMEQTLTSYALDFFAERGLPKLPRWKMSLVCCLGSALVGIIFATQRGNELLEVFDHFIGSIALLLVAFMESLMLNWDFTYQRLEYALAKATYNNPSTPTGRRLGPASLCKLDFFFTVPILAGALALYLIVLDFMDGYGSYPKFVQAWGWVILVLILIISFSTLYKKDPSKLEAYDMEDIKINDSDVDTGNSARSGPSTPTVQLSEVV
ncbi:unnamed protein product [Cylindrotheca closterium]|uniref:Transporter n=1 Tax=Cylindrotheca closterium TaxID=2856 RepID=A0AAD2FKE8_9STRA|nr:unnamed protein product [Cylindrotheca closterium]